jgi:putative oxidoreductase
MPETRNPTLMIDEVGRSGIYPMSGPWPQGEARVIGQGDFGHPEQQHRAPTRWAEPLGPNESLTIGRLLFGGFFLYNGVNHFLNRAPMVGYARSKNVPFPNVAVLASGALLLFGGLSLMAGVRPKVGAALVTTFLTGVTPVMHNFWAEEGEQERTQELINFSKNVALIGGAAFAASVPEPWMFGPALSRDQHTLAQPR